MGRSGDPRTPDAAVRDPRLVTADRWGRRISIALVVFIVAGFALGLASDGMSYEVQDWVTAWLGPILIVGVVATIGVAGMVGGYLVIGWLGVFAGLALGVGFLLLALGFLRGGESAFFIAGAASLGSAIAAFYFGGRMRGALPASLAGAAASGSFLVGGIANCLLAYFGDRPELWASGVLIGAAGLGYLAADLVSRRRGAIEEADTTR